MKKKACIGSVFYDNHKYTTPNIPPKKGKPIEKWRHKANGSKLIMDGRATGEKKEEIG